MPIPLKLRKQIALDPFMARCIYEGCPNRPEWEHAMYFAGRKIQEAWAIVPCCTYHHREAGLNKEYNVYRALIRATDTDFAKYPKSRDEWVQKRKYLTSKYGALETAR